MISSTACFLVLLATPSALAFSNVQVVGSGKKSSVVIGDACYECPNFHYCSCIENSDTADKEERFVFEGKTCADLKYTERLATRARAYPEALVHIASPEARGSIQDGIS